MTATIESTNGSVPLYAEIGDSGLKRPWGLVQDEFLLALQGDKANAVYREMGDNDPIVGAVLYALENYVRQVEWSVQGEQAAFVEDNVAAMTHTVEEFIAEALSKLQYGWALHEVCYQNVGGRVMWRKFPIRAQETLRRWEFDEHGGIQGMWQATAAQNYAEVFIPIEKALLFRTSTRKNSPQGRSVLRSAYRPWWIKKRIEDIEAVGVERDLAGIPKIRVPAEVLAKGAGDAAYDAYKNIGVNLRNDEQACVMLPSDRDEHGYYYYDVELMTTGGTRAFSTDPILARYAAHIAMCAMADVIVMGHDKTGSFALSQTKEQLLTTGLQAQLDEIAAVINRHALPRLFALNGMTQGDTQIVPGELRAVNLADLADVLFKFSQAGMPLFPDMDLEAHLRSLADFPAANPAIAVTSPVEDEPAEPEEDPAVAKMGEGFDRLAAALLATHEPARVVVEPTNVNVAPPSVTVNVPRGGLTVVRDDNGLMTGLTDAAPD